MKTEIKQAASLARNFATESCYQMNLSNALLNLRVKNPAAYRAIAVTIADAKQSRQ